MIKKLSHIGIAVRNLAEQIPYYRDILGLPYLGEETVEEQKVKVALFQLGESRIELLEATSPESPIAKFIESKGPGLHHIALNVDDCGAALHKVAEQGVRLIDQTPRIGAEGCKIGFLHPKSSFGVLTEFTEELETENIK
jgi:methylmalonyl-CoA/ethylmalonyl-CoA epimerase